ncbi:MAG: copper resistance protein B [Gammaproteobacteria bacterium]|nr:copper resistance protein B [Gammaproteobacteria bacterium]
MKKILLATTLVGLLTNVVYADGMEDDPVVAKFMIDQFETRMTDGDDPLVLEAQGWIGKDLNKFWYKIDSEWVDGDNEELELQALYSRAISPYWDFQIGWRHDEKPRPTRDWLAVGIEGLAPYWFEVNAALFLGESGQSNFRFEAEYEWMFTQKVVLSPEFEINFHAKNDKETGTGSGLSDTQLGLRLRYEFKREFAPYIGVNWNKKYGNTKDYAKEEGEEDDDVQFVLGIKAWF